jgi:hypothetical protein
MRFATLQFGPEDRSVDLSVIPLPIRGDVQEYILSNVNRWRGQLGLKPISEEQMDDQLEVIELDGVTATVVNLAGQMRGDGMGTSHIGSAAPKPSDMAGSKPPASSPTSAGLQFEQPDGWQPGQLLVSRGGITLRHEAAFEVTDDGQRLEITVDRLPPIGNLAQNVNRWRAQIGLEPLTQQQLDSQLTKIAMGDTTADYIALTGDDDSILAAVAVRGNEAWYVKLKGGNQLAQREKRNFEAFLKSIRFP